MSEGWGGRKVAEFDFGTGEPYRGSGCLALLEKPVRGGVCDLGGVLDLARVGVPPMGDLKSSGRGGGGSFGRIGPGIRSACWKLSALGCLLVAEVMGACERWTECDGVDVGLGRGAAHGRSGGGLLVLVETKWSQRW